MGCPSPEEVVADLEAAAIAGLKTSAKILASSLVDGAVMARSVRAAIVSATDQDFGEINTFSSEAVTAAFREHYKYSYSGPETRPPGLVPGTHVSSLPGFVVWQTNNEADVTEYVRTEMDTTLHTDDAKAALHSKMNDKIIDLRKQMNSDFEISQSSFFIDDVRGTTPIVVQFDATAAFATVKVGDRIHTFYQYLLVSYQSNN